MGSKIFRGKKGTGAKNQGVNKEPKENEHERCVTKMSTQKGERGLGPAWGSLRGAQNVSQNHPSEIQAKGSSMGSFPHA